MGTQIGMYNEKTIVGFLFLNKIKNKVATFFVVWLKIKACL